MITVKQLKDLVHVYQKKVVDFSLEIDAEILEIIRIESDYTFSLFAQFIDKDDDSVLSASTVKEIRDYFKTRWKVLKNNNLAYTRFPFLPVNQFCLKVAEGIARPGEAVCTILMPSLLGLNRLASSLKFETEDDGHFKLEDYIVNQDYTKLIPIREIFEYAALNSDYVLPDFQPADAQLKYQLGGRDFVNLEEVTGEASQRFIRTLKQHHTRRYDNNSLGFAIKRLATELRKSSKSDAGNEQLADNKALGDAVHVFHNLWSELSPDLSLPQETNAAPIEILVKDLKLKSYGYGQATLESYLLCLFFHLKIELTEEEVSRVLAENIFPCTHQISDTLVEYLNQYPALFNISIQKEDQQQDSLPAMDTLLPDVLNALAKRPPMLDGDDSEFHEKFIGLVLKTSPYNLNLAADFIAPCIKRYGSIRNLNGLRGIITKVAARIADSCLRDMPYETNLHLLLPFFSENQQQAILDTHFEKLTKEYNTESRFKLLIRALQPKVASRLRSKYAQQLTPGILSFEDLIALSKKVSAEVIDEVFKNIATLYSSILDSYENSCSILAVLSEHGGERDTVLNFISTHLYEWLSPENCHSIKKLISSSKLYSLLAEQIGKHTTSFDIWKTHYLTWKNHYELQALLCQLLFLQYREHVKDSDTLFPLVQATQGELKLELIKEFRAVICTKALFAQYLEGIPKFQHECYLGLVQWESWINSLSELKEFASLFSSVKLRNSIFSRFTSVQLKCSEEEFSALTESQYAPKDLELINNFIPEAAIAELEVYLMSNRKRRHSYMVFFNNDRLSTERERIAQELIKTLKSNCSPAEKIYALRECKMQIENNSHGTLRGASGSHLYSIICGLLKKPLSEEVDEPRFYPMSIG